MGAYDFDLAIVGAGSGGLTAATFAARLGAKVALVERDRIGGDCTWTGCVPSKALLRAARAAHAVRTASRFGIGAAPPVTDMPRVREYVRSAIRQVYAFETPEELAKQGIEVVPGAARFTGSHSIVAGERTIRSKNFLITTGARPRLPAISGLDGVPFTTYEQIFDNDRLPRSMMVVGGGPIGLEMAQAYQRLGAQVTLIADRLLPKDEPEAGDLMRGVLENEGVRFVRGRAQSVRRDGGDLVVTSESVESRGDFLLVASGRQPAVAGLDLEKAGVEYSEKGIPVDRELRTNVKNIYAAGDVIGGLQFTHLAGWQAFQAVRNALLPGSSEGLTDLVPWVTFTDPEVAHAGLTVEQARVKFGSGVKVCKWGMRRTDRAICDNDPDGFLKVVAGRDGTIVGATVVNARAGEVLAELMLAMRRKMKLSEVAAAIHPYPTYSTAVQQLAAELTVEGLLSGVSGTVVRGLSRMVR